MGFRLALDDEHEAYQMDIDERQRNMLLSLLHRFDSTQWYIKQVNNVTFVENKSNGKQFHWYEVCLVLLYVKIVKTKEDMTYFTDIDCEDYVTMALFSQDPILYLFNKAQGQISDKF